MPSISRLKILFTPILAGVLAVTLVAGAAPARERLRQGSVSTERGTTNWQGRVEREKGQMQRQTDWQNARGDGSRVVQKNWDAANGAGAINRTTSLANGRTANNSATVSKSENGATVQGTYTGYNGKSHDYSGTVEKGGQ